MVFSWFGTEMNRIGPIILLISFVCLMFSDCGNDRGSYTEKNKLSGSSRDSLILVIKGRSGESVFEITRRLFYVDYVKSTSGIYIKAIDSVTSGGKYAWIYSVNDSVGQMAANEYITHDSDIIKWHYRKL
jgi:hypothetical protein